MADGAGRRRGSSVPARDRGRGLTARRPPAFSRAASSARACASSSALRRASSSAALRASSSRAARLLGGGQDRDLLLLAALGLAPGGFALLLRQRALAGGKLGRGQRPPGAGGRAGGCRGAAPGRRPARRGAPCCARAPAGARRAPARGALLAHFDLHHLRRPWLKLCRTEPHPPCGPAPGVPRAARKAGLCRFRIVAFTHSTRPILSGIVRRQLPSQRVRRPRPASRAASIASASASRPAPPPHAPHGHGRTPVPVPRPKGVSRHTGAVPSLRRRREQAPRVLPRCRPRPAAPSRRGRFAAIPAPSETRRPPGPRAGRAPESRRSGAPGHLQTERQVGRYGDGTAGRPSEARANAPWARAVSITSPPRAQPNSPPGQLCGQVGDRLRVGADDEADHPLLRQPLARDDAAAERAGFRLVVSVVGASPSVSRGVPPRPS